MSVEQYFLDPRRQRSQELAFAAERTEDSGDLAAALAYYADAARLEEENALGVPGDTPRVRSVLAVSAVALWLRAERWDDDARAGCAFLAEPTKLTPDGLRAIRKLVDRASRTSEVEHALGTGGVYVPVEATLSGGLVREGLAPSTVVAERRDVLAPLLMRVAEWRNHKRYRRAGPSTLANRYDIFEAPAIAGSFALRLYVGATEQQMLDGVAASPKDVVEHFLSLAEAVASGPDEMRRITQVAVLTGTTRQSLSTALRREGEEKPISLDGVLKSVNLRGTQPRIGVDVADGVRFFHTAKGEHDDTIGPKTQPRGAHPQPPPLERGWRARRLGRRCRTPGGPDP
jgi:hypothetical protein